REALQSGGFLHRYPPKIRGDIVPRLAPIPQVSVVFQYPAWFACLELMLVDDGSSVPTHGGGKSGSRPSKIQRPPLPVKQHAGIRRAPKNGSFCEGDGCPTPGVIPGFAERRESV